MLRLVYQLKLLVLIEIVIFERSAVMFAWNLNSQNCEKFVS